MLTLHLGVNKLYDGFVLLRGLLVMFVVILCFAAATAATVGFSHRSADMIEKAELEVQKRNEQALRKLIP